MRRRIARNNRSVVLTLDQMERGLIDITMPGPGAVNQPIWDFGRDIGVAWLRDYSNAMDVLLEAMVAPRPQGFGPGQWDKEYNGSIEEVVRWWSEEQPEVVIPRFGACLADPERREFIISGWGFGVPGTNRWLRSLVENPVEPPLTEEEQLILIDAIGSSGDDDSAELLDSIATQTPEAQVAVHKEIALMRNQVENLKVLRQMNSSKNG